MNRRTRAWGAVTIALALTALVGCSGGPASNPGDASYGWFASEVKLKDGSTVQCVAASQGGVSCDWEGAR